MNASSQLALLFISTGAIACVLAGCNSAPPPGPSRDALQPMLIGEAAFLDGSLEVSAQLAPFHRDGSPGDQGPRSDRVDSIERRSGSRPPPPRDGGFVGGGPPPGGGGMAPPQGRALGGGPGSRPAMASPIRHTLTIAFRNVGAQPVRLRVADISSPIGNFVAFPETFTLAPGETQPLEAMHSSYSENFSELGVSIRIRTGDGREGEQLIILGDGGAEPPLER
jgi:hypothetical protein